MAPHLVLNTHFIIPIVEVEVEVGGFLSNPKLEINVPFLLTAAAVTGIIIGSSGHIRHDWNNSLNCIGTGIMMCNVPLMYLSC